MTKVIYEKNSDQINYVYLSKNKYVDDNSSCNVKPHFHDAIELKFVTNGEYKLMLGGTEKTLVAGEMLFIKPKEMHYNISTQFTEYYTLVFSSKIIFNVCGKNKIFSGVIKNEPRVFESIKETFEHTYEVWNDLNSDKRKAFLYRLIGTIAEFNEPIDYKASESEYEVGKILQFIQDNIQEELTLEMISKKFGYAPSYFSALFKKYVGINFNNYLNRFRIDTASRMLNEDKTLPLWKVAENVGYKSYVTFYRAYKKYVNTELTNKS